MKKKKNKKIGIFPQKIFSSCQIRNAVNEITLSHNDRNGCIFESDSRVGSCGSITFWLSGLQRQPSATYYHYRSVVCFPLRLLSYFLPQDVVGIQIGTMSYRR